VSPGLHAEHLSYRIGDRVLVDDVTVAAEPGEVIAFVGPNGAGKSTLCALLAGDLQPSSGVVRLDGRRLDNWNRRELARQRAVLPQVPHVSGSFDVDDIVAMGRHPWTNGSRIDAMGDADLARASLAEVDAAHLTGRLWSTLSGGERARVALARVLVQGAPVLLLDEPTASLDLRHQHLVGTIARRRADAGAVVIVVLHDLTLAAAYADRALAMADGRVVADGPITEVLTEALLTDLYRIPVNVADHPSQHWKVPVASRSENVIDVREPY